MAELKPIPETSKEINLEEFVPIPSGSTLLTPSDARSQIEFLQLQPEFRILQHTQSQEQAKQLGRTVAAMGISATGTALGSLTSPTTGVLGPVIGAGSAEIINQSLGLTEPGVQGVAMSAALPTILGGAGALTRGAALEAPGIRQIVKEPLIEDVNTMLKRLRSGTSVKEMFKQAERAGSIRFLQLPETEKVINEMGKTLNLAGTSSLGIGRAKRILLDYNELASRALKKGISGKEIMTRSSVLSKDLSALEKTGGLPHETARQVRAAILQDLETAPTRVETAEATTLFKQARFAASRQFALSDLGEWISGATKQLKGQKVGVVDLDARQVLDRIRQATNPDSKNYDKFFGPALKDDLPEMTKLLERLNEIGPITMELGPGGLVIRGALAGMGFSAGSSVGGPVGGMVGAVMGASLPEELAVIVTSPIGRKLLTRMVIDLGQKGKGTRLSGMAIQALGSALRTASEIRPENDLPKAEREKLSLAVNKDPQKTIEEKIQAAQQLGGFSQVTE